MRAGSRWSLVAAQPDYNLSTTRDGQCHGVEHQVDLGVSLFTAYRYTQDRVFRALQEAGFDDWTLAQCRVVQRIWPDGSRLTGLVARR